MAHEINPSPFHLVRDNSTIGACLNLMQKRGLSFLLVENNNKRLVGIFTLKDLLKNYTALNADRNQNKPIRAFMSKPVQTISAHHIHKAPKMMIDAKIRHLPITSDDGSRVIGVVDMESLLAASLNEQKILKNYKAKDLIVYSPNGALMKLIKNVLKPYERIQVDKLWASRLKDDSQFESQVRAYDLFVFDLGEPKDLRVALKLAPYIHHYHKKMLVMIGPEGFPDEASKKAIMDLSVIRGVKVFHKPVEVHDLLLECLK
jgi:CBS domain-containing protein